MNGRLTRPPHPVLFELLYEPPMARAQQDVLPYLLAIDAAHVVMLAERALVPRDTAAALLRVNCELTVRLDAGDRVLDPPPGHRGVYYAYEREYITRLGETVGGAAHLARSRNDINAAVTRLRLRRSIEDTADRCADLVDAIVTAAAAYVETTMSGFTHLQPAQPTTLGHYFAGVSFELLRSMELLDRAYDVVNRSPMGAAAGYGTSFPVDRERVAELLGFAGVVENSLDAVASRDFAVHVLQAVAALGVTITRVATDLQTWSSVAYGFIGWPDDFVSTSSIMPQKRNAFVLEDVRGQATQAIGGLVATLVGMKNVPFANSVEVSAEASAHVWPAMTATDTACRLLTLLIGNLDVFPDRARAFAASAETGMTAVADWLVTEYGLAFRTAHDVVSRAIGEAAPGSDPPDPSPQPFPRKRGEGVNTLAPERGEGRVRGLSFHARLERRLAEEIGSAGQIPEAKLAQVLDPGACVRAAASGGGPAPGSVLAQLDRIAATLDAWRARFSERRRAGVSSAAQRDSAAAEIVRAAAERRADRDVPNSVCE